ncbi:outer membrane beta-barrel protein [Aliidiomarina sp. Khilg15.8]
MLTTTNTLNYCSISISIIKFQTDLYMHIRLAALITLFVIFSSTAIASETRVGGGLGYGDCRGGNDECKSQEFFRFSLEQELTSQLSIDFIGDTKVFNSVGRFTSHGVNLKYAFSETPNSLYIKAGPHYYEHYEFAAGSFGPQSRSGFGFSGSLGWEKAQRSGLGYGAEVWYRTLDEFDAVGVSIFVNYGFNIF